MAVKSKYRAKAVTVDGVRFASKAEARRFGELKLLERAGEISHLAIQPPFKCVIDGKLICTYFADFSYFTKSTPAKRGELIVEDVKSKPTRTPVYMLKRKLVAALFPGTKIVEVNHSDGWRLRKAVKV